MRSPRGSDFVVMLKYPCDLDSGLPDMDLSLPCVFSIEDKVS
jgi:hypothetical protein